MLPQPQCFPAAAKMSKHFFCQKARFYDAIERKEQNVFSVDNTGPRSSGLLQPLDGKSLSCTRMVIVDAGD